MRLMQHINVFTQQGERFAWNQQLCRYRTLSKYQKNKCDLNIEIRKNGKLRFPIAIYLSINFLMNVLYVEEDSVEFLKTLYLCPPGSINVVMQKEISIPILFNIGGNAILAIQEMPSFLQKILVLQRNARTFPDR